MRRRDSRHKVAWVAAANGEIPLGAVDIGCKDGLDHLYVGRVHLQNGDVVPGTIVPSKRACFYVADGKEQEASDYEVLVNTQPTGCFIKWFSPSIDGSMPKTAVKCGIHNSPTGPATLYAAKAKVPLEGNSYYVCKVRNGDLTALMAYNGECHNIETGKFKILCATDNRND